MPWSAARPPGAVAALLPARGPGNGEGSAVETETEPLALHRLRWWQLAEHHYFIREVQFLARLPSLRRLRQQRPASTCYNVVLPPARRPCLP